MKITTYQNKQTRNKKTIQSCRTMLIAFGSLDRAHALQSSPRKPAPRDSRTDLPQSLAPGAHALLAPGRTNSAAIDNSHPLSGPNHSGGAAVFAGSSLHIGPHPPCRGIRKQQRPIALPS